MAVVTAQRPRAVSCPLRRCWAGPTLGQARPNAPGSRAKRALAFPFEQGYYLCLGRGRQAGQERVHAQMRGSYGMVLVLSSQWLAPAAETKLVVVVALLSYSDGRQRAKPKLLPATRSSRSRAVGGQEEEERRWRMDSAAATLLDSGAKEMPVRHLGRRPQPLLPLPPQEVRCRPRSPPRPHRPQRSAASSSTSRRSCSAPISSSSSPPSSSRSQPASSNSDRYYFPSIPFFKHLLLDLMSRHLLSFITFRFYSPIRQSA
jgi:hypothetical protein